jgi:hypothetical protein
MLVEGFFDGLGQVLGTLIRWIVEGLSGFFALFANAGEDFLQGLSRALGMQTSLLGLIALVIGLMLLAAAVRAFIRRAWISGSLYLLLGLWLLSLMIH